ncbi:MAG: hypothetical protein WC325_11965 [Candidatus Bathyarchaeia archaeon]
MKHFFLKQISTHVFLAIIVVVMVLSLSTLGLLTITQNITSSGTITTATANLGVFWDSNCAIPLSAISWGAVSPGSSVSQTIYIKNTGDIPLTLSMSTSSWNPATAGNSVAITWNREGTVLAAGQIISAELTLAVASGISGVTTFSVNILISGTG